MPQALSSQTIASFGSARISRDVTERGRDVGAVIEQYTSQVKPAFERFIGPSRKHADVIIPWSRRALLEKSPSLQMLPLPSLPLSTLRKDFFIGSSSVTY